MSDLLTALQKKILVMDGAMGTYLMQSGLSRTELPDLWNVENPQAVLNTHREYVASGADILTTNTFNANPARWPNKVAWQAINGAAVKIARQAGARFVAGDLGPALPVSPDNVAQIENSFFSQAQVLSDAGVDLLLAETLTSFTEAKIACAAIDKATKGRIPYAISLSPQTQKNLRDGKTTAEAINWLSQNQVPILGFNCLDSHATLDMLQTFTTPTEPLWLARPSAGISPHIQTTAEFAKMISSFIQTGCRLLGSCCGTNPFWTKAIRHHLDQNPEAGKRIALFGGAFNPPHLAHMEIAHSLVDLPFDEVWLIPSFRHPFDKEMVAFQHRVNMLKVMVENLGPKIVVMDIEKELAEKKSYTIDLIRLLKQRHPQYVFSWVMGVDVLAECDAWKNFAALEREAPFILLARATQQPHKIPQRSSILKKEFPAISSTAVRDKLMRGENPTDLLPAAVLNYIQKNRLYSTSSSLLRN